MSSLAMKPDLAALVTAEGDGGTVDVRCPFDGTPIGTLPRSSREDVATGFDRARGAQERWERTPMRDRVAVLTRFRDLVLDHNSELLTWIQRETGKSRASAFEEVTDVALWAGYLAHRGPAALKDRRRSGAIPLLTSTVERRVPYGVVGVITPWNYPFTLPVTDSLPALLAGNAVVLKPDDKTPHTALYALSLLEEAGLPPGLLQIVLGDGPEVGGEVVEHADHMVFTGSTATGRTLATRCADRLIGFSAELGGKNPLLVLEDADVERAAVGAVTACFSNSGQLCISMERIYVHDSQWDAFTHRFLEHVSAMDVRAGLTWEADMGSLISAQQLETVTRHVDDAVAQGARVLAGGRARPDLGPYFYEPTVLTDVQAGMEAHSGETFGPVVSLYRVSSDDEAIAAANDTPYGLNASVWSKSRGPQVARRLQAGSVNINEGYAATWASHDAPMGGVKDSGLGRRHGTEGILGYTESQTIAQQRLVPVSGPPGMTRERWASIMHAGVRVLSRFN
ncbi:succinic semialdehyde dehydrogenase [Brevibacterium yomogidense]|nr:succinic semialdehyde dehydrogenase [Brevibacterium yomogidense]